jgi:hypothetical protein
MTSNDKEIESGQSAGKTEEAQPLSRSRSQSAPKTNPKSGRGARAATITKTSSSSTPFPERLNLRETKETVRVGKTSGTFAQAAAWPPSPDPLASTKAAIASVTINFTAAVKKHQDNFQALLKSVVPGTTVPASKIKRLRADNIALMRKASILVLHAGGMRFSLEALYDLACAEEKEAKRQVDYKVANDLAIADAKSTATMMSSIMDSG